MDEHKFLFVTCVNDDVLYAICVHHIEQLSVPEGYRVEFLAIRDAKSMAAGYNQALRHDAKYKVYLHQDAFILNKHFLQEILILFQSNPTLGLMGMTGCIGRQPDGNWCKGLLVGKMLAFKDERIREYNYKEVAMPFERVDLLDGFIMITQYDVPWREDIFDGFHLYDSSQSIEFANRGYLVGIPKQNAAWTMHYINHPIDDYEWRRYQGIFQANYASKQYH